MPDPPFPFLTPVFTLRMRGARAGSDSGEQETGTSSLARELGRLRREIVDVGDEIRGIKDGFKAAKDAHDEKEVDRLSSELKLLREKENLLRQKELKLMVEAGTGTQPMLKCAAHPWAV